MDHTQEFTAVEFCAGYAGLHLGLKRVIPNLRVIAFSEIEAFACANLVAKMEEGLLDPAPVWTDLKTFPGEAFRDRVGILCGGYPCQPFSAAGKRLGADDPRHLWPHIRLQIALMRPLVCFFENVDGHISMGLREVLADLRMLGYRVETDSGEPTWGVFSATEVGAPHQRKRVFILAVAHDHHQRVQELGNGVSSGEELAAAGNRCASSWPSRPGERQYCWEPPRVTTGVCQADAESQFRRGLSRREATEQPELGSASGDDGFEGQTQPPVGGDLDGTPGRVDAARGNRVDELRLLGNGVVPDTAEKAFRTLWGRFFGRS